MTVKAVTYTDKWRNRKKYVVLNIVHMDEKNPVSITRFKFTYGREDIQLADSLSSSLMMIADMLNDGRLEFIKD